MKRAVRVMAKMATGLTAVVVAVTGISAHVAIVAALLVLMIVGAICWTITDSGRSERLAMLIDAIRGNYRYLMPRANWPGLPADTKRNKAA